MPLSLTTQRLTLQHWTDLDARWYRELARARGGTVPTLGEATDRLAGIVERDRRSGLALLTVRRRQERDFVGYCGVVAGRSTLEEPELVFELFPEARQHGYATEAATAIVGEVARTGRQRIWATVRSWNTPSFRVLDKLDFRRRHSLIDDRGELVWLSRDLR